MRMYFSTSWFIPWKSADGWLNSVLLILLNGSFGNSYPLLIYRLDHLMQYIVWAVLYFFYPSPLISVYYVSIIFRSIFWIGLWVEIKFSYSLLFSLDKCNSTYQVFPFSYESLWALLKSLGVDICCRSSPTFTILEFNNQSQLLIPG